MRSPRGWRILHDCSFLPLLLPLRPRLLLLLLRFLELADAGRMRADLDMEPARETVVTLVVVAFFFFLPFFLDFRFDLLFAFFESFGFFGFLLFFSVLLLASRAFSASSFRT